MGIGSKAICKLSKCVTDDGCANGNISDTVVRGIVQGLVYTRKALVV